MPDGIYIKRFRDSRRICLALTLPCLFFVCSFAAVSCAGPSFSHGGGEGDAAPQLDDDAGDVPGDDGAAEEPQPSETWILFIVGGDRVGYGRFFVATSDGGIVFTGIMRGGEYEDNAVWVVRLDGEGDVVWQKIISGYGWMGDIEQTVDGGFVLAGLTESFGRNGEGCIVKMDGAGNFAWQKTLGSSGFDRLDSVYETSEGNLMVGGTTDGNMILAALDGGGNMLWQKSYTGGRQCAVYRLAACADGDILGAGIAIRGGFELARLGQNGDIVWHKSILTGASGDYGYYMAVIEAMNGDIVLAMENTVMRLDGEGNVLWQKAASASASFYKLVEMDDGELLFTGGDMENGRMWLGGMDYRGNMTWQETIESGCLEVGSDLVRSADGGIMAISGGCDASHIVKLGAGGEFYGACSMIVEANFTLVPASSTVSAKSLTVEDPGLLLQDSSASIADSAGIVTFQCPE
jgi:hypothetical protein